MCLDIELARASTLFVRRTTQRKRRWRVGCACAVARCKPKNALAQRSWQVTARRFSWRSPTPASTRREESTLQPAAEGDSQQQHRRHNYNNDNIKVCCCYKFKMPRINDSSTVEKTTKMEVGFVRKENLASHSATPHVYEPANTEGI